jgi:hypothetical protein
MIKIYVPALTFFLLSHMTSAVRYYRSHSRLVPSERGFRSHHIFLIDQHAFWLSKYIRTLNWEWVHRSFVIQFVSTSSGHFVSLCIYATRKDHSCNVCTVKSMVLWEVNTSEHGQLLTARYCRV